MNLDVMGKGGFFRRPWYVLSLIVLLSVTVKIVLFLCFYHGNLSQIIQLDTSTYVAPAKSLLASGSYLNAGHALMFTRTPGYPTFLAFVFLLFGQHFPAVVMVQIVLSGLLVIEAFLIARRLFNLTTAYAAAIIVSGDFLLFSYTVMVLSDFFYAVIIGLFFTVGCYLFTNHSKILRLSLAFGALLAVATLTRPISYYLIIPIFIGAAAYFIHRRFSAKTLSLALLLIVAPSLILVGGWQMRNKIELGTYSYTNIASYNLYWHYAVPILQKQKKINYSKSRSILAQRLNAQESLTPAGRNKWMTDQALRIMRAHPLDVLKEMVSGFPKLMLGIDTSWLQFFANDDYQSLLKEKERIKQAVSHLQYSQLMPLLNTNRLIEFLIAGFLISFVLLNYFLLILGFFHRPNTLFRDHLYAHLFLLGSLFYFIFLSSNSVFYSRFRLPFELLINIYAAYGLSCVIAWVKSRRKLKLAQNDAPQTAME